MMSALAGLAEHCRELEEVDFYFCQRITDQGVLRTPTQIFTALAGLGDLAWGCHGLRAVTVSGCNKISDAGHYLSQFASIT
jgi:hypothetical protein